MLGRFTTVLSSRTIGSLRLLYQASNRERTYQTPRENSRYRNRLSVDICCFYPRDSYTALHSSVTTTQGTFISSSFQNYFSSSNLVFNPFVPIFLNLSVSLFSRATVHSLFVFRAFHNSVSQWLRFNAYPSPYLCARTLHPLNNASFRRNYVTPSSYISVPLSFRHYILPISYLTVSLFTWRTVPAYFRSSSAFLLCHSVHFLLCFSVPQFFGSHLCLLAIHFIICWSRPPSFRSSAATSLRSPVSFPIFYQSLHVFVSQLVRLTVQSFVHQSTFISQVPLTIHHLQFEQKKRYSIVWISSCIAASSWELIMISILLLSELRALIAHVFEGRPFSSAIILCRAMQ